MRPMARKGSMMMMMMNVKLNNEFLPLQICSKGCISNPLRHEHSNEPRVFLHLPPTLLHLSRNRASVHSSTSEIYIEKRCFTKYNTNTVVINRKQRCRKTLKTLMKSTILEHRYERFAISMFSVTTRPTWQLYSRLHPQILLFFLLPKA